MVCWKWIVCNNCGRAFGMNNPKAISLPPFCIACGAFGSMAPMVTTPPPTKQSFIEKVGRWLEPLGSYHF